MSTYDAVVVGGGFYGCAIAVHLAEQGMRRILLVEQEQELLTCASWANQARVHNGYHYPRSFVTALRSRVNLPRFQRDYGEAVRTDATSLYAIAQQQSKVTPGQFERFMTEIGAPFKPAGAEHVALFNARLVAAVYEVQESVFDASALRGRFVRELVARHVELALGTQASLQQRGGGVEVALRGSQEQRVVSARWVFNCTYTGFNTLLAPLQPGELTPLKHEVTELALVRPPPQLRDLNITLMDGPFFSITRFPAEICHCLTHVRYTPHSFTTDTRGHSDPRAQLRTALPQTRAHFMVADGARYLPCLREVVYRKSLFEIKTVLMRREIDDGRPILLRREPRFGNLISVLGGKIDNIYDVLELLKPVYSC